MSSSDSDKRRFLEECADILRKNPTPEEKKIWYDFFRKIPIKIRRQVVIDEYIVDFYCPRERIVIEIDGIQHYTLVGKQKDENRDAHLASLGMRVLRFSNIGVNTMFFHVCREIYAALDPKGNDFLSFFPEEKAFYVDYRKKLEADPIKRKLRRSTPRDRT